MPQPMLKNEIDNALLQKVVAIANDLWNKLCLQKTTFNQTSDKKAKKSAKRL